MKIVHLNPDKKSNPAEELAKILVAKWERRDTIKAEKKYNVKLDNKKLNRS